MGISRRSFTRAGAGVLAIFLLAALAACGIGGDSGGVKLKVWGWRPEDAAAYKKIFTVFEKEHPGISVQYVPYKDTDYDTVLKTGLSGASGPDVAQLRAYSANQPLIAAGNLTALDGKVAGLDSWPKITLDAARGLGDGKIYGVPFALQTLHVIYNKDTFAKLGIEVPKTWNDMIAAFKKIQDTGVTPLANTVTDTWMLPIEQEIFANTVYGGQQWVDGALKGQEKFSGRAWISSIETWLSTKQYWGPNAETTSYTSAQALFTSGKAAMFPGGIFEIAGFRSANPGLNLGLFNVPPPSGAVVDHPLVPGYLDGSFGVNAKSGHHAEAMQLVNWMATKEFGKLFSDTLTQISAVPGVTPTDPLLKQALSAYQADPAPYTVASYFSNGDPAAWTIATTDYMKVVLGQMSATDAANAIQRGVDQWFKSK
ncbi:ABC transporter substrate-binding protein [Spirillospora sp. CA-255316]